MRIVDTYGRTPPGPSSTNLSDRLVNLERYVQLGLWVGLGSVASVAILSNFTPLSMRSCVAVDFKKRLSLGSMLAISRRSATPYPPFSTSSMCARTSAARLLTCLMFAQLENGFVVAQDLKKIEIELRADRADRQEKEHMAGIAAGETPSLAII